MRRERLEDGRAELDAGRFLEEPYDGMRRKAAPTSGHRPPVERSDFIDRGELHPFYGRHSHNGWERGRCSNRDCSRTHNFACRIFLSGGHAVPLGQDVRDDDNEYASCGHVHLRSPKRTKTLTANPWLLRGDCARHTRFDLDCIQSISTRVARRDFRHSRRT